MFAIDAYPRRWSAAAVAAAFTLPPETRQTVDGWARLLDGLHDAISDVVLA